MDDFFDVFAGFNIPQQHDSICWIIEAKTVTARWMNAHDLTVGTDREGDIPHMKLVSNIAVGPRATSCFASERFINRRPNVPLIVRSIAIPHSHASFVHQYLAKAYNMTNDMDKLDQDFVATYNKPETKKAYKNLMIPLNDGGLMERMMFEKNNFEELSSHASAQIYLQTPLPNQTSHLHQFPLKSTCLS